MALAVEYPFYQLSNVDFADLVTLDGTTAVRIANILTTDGAMQINGIPNFATARQDAFNELPKCFRGENALPKIAMNDGSSRTTVAAMTINGIAAKMTSHCGEKSEKLRNAVDATIDRLFSALDIAASVYKRTDSVNAIRYVMEPYNSFGSLIANGSHLEHLHMYEASSTGVSELPTMDFHVDSGLLVAMTTGFYSSSSPDSSSSTSRFRGLLLELASGLRVQAGTENDAALVVMVGSAAAGWLQPVLGAPLRPAPHSLLAGLSDPHETRSWFGKMYLPPQDALLPATGFNNNIPVTYGHHRRSELASKGSSSSSGLLLPAGCGTGNPAGPLSPVSYSGYGSLATNDLCQLDGGTGVVCWMQCMSVTALPCGTAAVCVDTVTGQQVPGDAHCPESDLTACQLQCPTTPPSNSTSASFDGFCFGSGVSMFMAGFTAVALEPRGSTECLNLLFPTWTLDSPLKLGFACVLVLLAAVGMQFVTHLRLQLSQCGNRRSRSLEQKLLGVLLQGVQVVLGYLLMLVAMTYSAELFSMVCVGLLLGYVAFHADFHWWKDDEENMRTGSKEKGDYVAPLPVQEVKENDKKDGLAQEDVAILSTGHSCCEFI